MADNSIELKSTDYTRNQPGGGNAAFGFARALSRVHHKYSVIFVADASGNWLTATGTQQLILFEHGINDNFQSIPNPFANAGISGLPAPRSVEITNAMRNGGLSMTDQAILLAFGSFIERVRYVTPDANNIPSSGSVSAGTYVNARVQRSGGTVGDYEWALVDRLVPVVLSGSEYQLLPVNSATDCNLNLGIPQLNNAGTGWEFGGVPGLGQNSSGSRWVLRDDVILDPGLSSNQDQPNRIQVSYPGLVAAVEKIALSPAKTTGTLLAVDMIFVADVAYGNLTGDGKSFVFKSQFDADRYESLRCAV